MPVSLSSPNKNPHPSLFLFLFHFLSFRKKDMATAILEPSKKRSPNRMVVDEATSDDNSVVALSTAKVFNYLLNVSLNPLHF